MKKLFTERHGLNEPAYKVIWPRGWPNRNEEWPSDPQLFDLLEFLYEHAGLPKVYGRHSFFGYNQRRELASFSFGQKPLRSSAPEIVIPTDRHLARLNVGMNRPYWFKLSFHYTFDDADGPTGWWISAYHFGICQGPVVLAA